MWPGVVPVSSSHFMGHLVSVQFFVPLPPIDAGGIMLMFSGCAEVRRSQESLSASIFHKLLGQFHKNYNIGVLWANMN